ncbi:MAG: FtsW/RodA/SpoVE family cell cycle protein, partial [Clostridiales bacterium]|nr:FtsW/RodA/SpoVE family cell cycle protein [Clostridiales bacterium]
MNETQRKPRTYKLFVSGSFDIPFLAITIGLLTIGLIMLFSASYPYSYQYEDNSYHYIMRQGLWAAIGLIAMFVVSKIDYHILRLFAWPLYGVTIALLGLVLVMPEVVPGFKRWIKIGPITFQPSDIAKFALILIFAHLISLNIKRMQGFRFGVLFLGVLLAAVCGLVIAGNHVSGTMLIAMIGLVMMYVGGTKKKYFIIGIGAMVVVVAAVFLVPSFMDYAGERITAWIDKDYDPTGARWQTNNSLYAIGSGGLLGTGLGNSKQKYLYVSEPHNDFI